MSIKIATEELIQDSEPRMGMFPENLQSVVIAHRSRLLSAVALMASIPDSLSLFLIRVSILSSVVLA